MPLHSLNYLDLEACDCCLDTPFSPNGVESLEVYESKRWSAPEYFARFLKLFVNIDAPGILRRDGCDLSAWSPALTWLSVRMETTDLVGLFVKLYPRQNIVRSPEAHSWSLGLG